MQLKKTDPIPKRIDTSEFPADIAKELLQMSQNMDDPEINEAIGMVVALLENPDVAVAGVSRTIVKLEALAAKFGMMATHYKTFGKAGDTERYKKDTYYTMREHCQRLADSLKYVVRVHEISR